MILALRISSMLALALGCILLVAAGFCWWNDSPQNAHAQDIPNVADTLAQAGRTSATSPATSVLVAQAQAFAAQLNPPQKPESQPSSASAIDSVPQPAAAIKLLATSCYPDQPAKSMALVSGGNSREEAPRWVKEGSQFGAFAIHEIRRGQIVYRQGDQLYEVAIDHQVDQSSIVRGAHVDSPRVSAAAGHGLGNLSTPTGPNDIEISGY
ncbi:MAG: hypothetical protein ACM3VT_10335 [Solirubrobacterales bacterium]